MAGRSASVSRARISSAFGPWRARSANASERSVNSTSNPGAAFSNQSRSFWRLPALTTTM
jgi:hypothetical protein